MKRNTLNREQSASSLADAQETRTVADPKTGSETKTICTQTSIEALQLNEKCSNDNKITTDENHFTSSCVHMKQQKSSAFWCIDEDPAPQWLIEEALNRGTEHIEQQTKRKISSNKEAEYERIILELETKLALTKEKFEEALNSKFIVKEKYKKSLENLKAEARKENEVLQERIVRICTSVLENFGPRSNNRRRSNGYQIKSYRKLKCHERITSKLCKKLRMAVAKSNKLKRKLAATRRTLKNKLEEHESIGKCFDQLKQDMEATETNLNDLISENLSLKRKMDDTRDWLQHTMGKVCTRCASTFEEAYKSRELKNLKKKVKEDSETIAQLKNRLARSESANANKGFLLNSYKGQLTDLGKEKCQLSSTIKNLENEIGNIRSSNSQLRAKISVLNNEKGKILSDVEKSKTNMKEQMETQCAKKCEETVQQEIEIIVNKYEETIKTMKTKMLVTKNQNVEYLNAIKEFLNKLYEHQENCEVQRTLNKSETCERETEEVICNILNITPKELSRITDTKSQDSINSWIAELNRITTANHFSKDLSKFLLRKVTKMIKT